MTLTRERKIYVGLLAIGVVALMVDRLTGGGASAGSGPASAYAVARQPAAPARAGELQAASGTARAPAGPALAVRLREAARGSHPANGRRDLFRTPDAWAPPVEPAPPPVTVPVARDDSVERFQNSHRLTAVLLTDRDSHAVVDGHLIRPGQVLDGFTLTSVTPDTAIFRSKSGTAILRTMEIKAR